jgi:Phospholipase_D-nuclease N-terminal
MLLPLVLFALVTVGICVPCLLDVARTPRYQVRTLTKASWLIVVIVFWLFGSVAWLLLGRPGGPLVLLRRDEAWMARPGPAEALRRHPAGRAAEPGYGLDEPDDREPSRRSWPIGPDDDEEFLLALERQIRRAEEDW